MLSAYLLVSHGSRDPRQEIAMQQLAKLVNNKLESNLQRSIIGGVVSPPKCELVGTAYLEFKPEPLHEQIKRFAQMLKANGYHRLKILPLFLLPGVHVMEDIPGEVALAQQAVEDIIIELQPYLGSHAGVEKLLAKQIAKSSENGYNQGWILLTHGSRRPGSKKQVEAMAANLRVLTAYWSVAPSLESRVKQLVSAGCKNITILPYFLFAGGITDAIARSLLQLKLQFPAVRFQLAEPLGASAELADLIWDLIHK
ncbi:cobalamin biosynthesis CbiX protein [Tolypothrix sp. NIES-4075]|uniref:sirohydrochlorin chelatase n=1 Tax=Tolypothrix sp. NIES-4075 TaxID=2005459 RepID=UPI000B5CACDA|nr:sirohydrochlorin chelatase [Tolypothrix sp. NIES-4075]GAX45103.1 cobalamin biosynthesis CbiX protein [Tolypothrix sp. NIES-4075]